jgi:hypothetical protein
MNQIKHAPEPWKMTDADDTDVCIFAANDNWLANVGINVFNGSIADEHLQFLFDMDKANARRVVACVNACEGVTNEVLELFELGKVISQRDELLAALRYHQEQTRPIQQTADLIAKIEATV